MFAQHVANWTLLLYEYYKYDLLPSISNTNAAGIDLT